MEGIRARTAPEGPGGPGELEASHPAPPLPHTGFAASSERKPLPVYIMNGRMPNERMPQIPVMVVNPRYN